MAQWAASNFRKSRLQEENMKISITTKICPAAMKGVALSGAMLAILGGCALPARAGIAQVSSRSALGGNDQLTWAQIANLAPFSSIAITTKGGLMATLSSNGELIGSSQGSGGGAPWDGNFAPGVPIVFTGQFTPAGNIVITFATPVSAVGAQMNYNVTNPPSDPFPFNISMSLHNSAAQLLAAYTAQGEQYAKPNNSAVFIGAVDSQAEISPVVFFTTTTGGPYPGSFAINNVSLDAPRHCTQ
jgi:hypothetical protein